MKKDDSSSIKNMASRDLDMKKLPFQYSVWAWTKNQIDEWTGKEFMFRTKRMQNQFLELCRAYKIKHIDPNRKKKRRLS